MLARSVSGWLKISARVLDAAKVTVSNRGIAEGLSRREREIMELLEIGHYEGMVPMNQDMAREALRQIGTGNVLAISGGRVQLDNAGAVVLPVGSGYSVMIQLHGSDTYTVRRLFKRGSKIWVKGTVRDVYCEDIGDVAYYASCYVNVDFGQALQAVVSE